MKFMDELGAIFGSLKGVEFSGLWSLAWFGCRLGELVTLTPNDINKKPDVCLPPSLAKKLGPDDYCVKFLATDMGVYTDYGADILKAMTELHFLKPLEREAQSSFNEPDDREVEEVKK